MSDALNEAISRRGVRVSECVRLPVKDLNDFSWAAKAKAQIEDTMMRAYASVEANGRAARIKGEPASNNPYMPRSKGSAWYHAWQRGWEQG